MLKLLLAMAAMTATLTVPSTAFAQKSEAFAIRLQGGLMRTQYSAEVTSNGDILDCGMYGAGYGYGGILNGIVEIPVSDIMGIGLGVGYADRGGQLTRNNTYPLRDPATGQDVTMTTEVALVAPLTFLEFQPDIRLALAGTFRSRSLGITIGPRLALPLTNSFTQKEMILTPGNATFTTNGVTSRTRTFNQGLLTTRANSLMGLSLGVDAAFPTSSTVSIVPSLTFDTYFSSIITDAPWTMWSIRFEMGVRFSVSKQEKPPIQPLPPPVIAETPPEPPPAAVPPSVSIWFTRFSGEVVTGNDLRAMTPIVNAVFFDSASAELPPAYQRTNTYNSTVTDAVSAHSALLARVAWILLDNPQGTVRLDGTTSGPASEPEGLALAERRTRAVRSALVAMGIAESRIQVTSSVLPRIPSSQEYPAGRAENRRVDIVVQNAPLQQWVSSVQFAKLQGTADLRTTVRNADARTPVRITGPGAQDTLVTGADSNVTLTVDMEIGVLASTVSLGADAHVGEGAGEGDAHAHADTTVSLAAIPRRIVKLATSDFEAVLRFDFNSAELSDDVKLLLRQLTDLLPDGSMIAIAGSADVMGSDARNRELSMQRAANTEQYIRSLTGNRFRVVISTTAQKFDESTPQGRFLNRSIRVTTR